MTPVESAEIVSQAAGMAKDYGPLASAVGIGFWIKLWISGVNSKIVTIEKDIKEILKLGGSLSEHKLHVEGSIDTMARSIKETDKDVGKLTANMETFWKFFEKNGARPSRASDPK